MRQILKPSMQNTHISGLADSEKQAIKLVLLGYLPASRNALKGCHWSIEHREKQRAAVALMRCIRSRLSSFPDGPSIGTITASSRSKINLSLLDSYAAMIGALFAGKSVPLRFTRKRKSAQK
jgi:hypothetical protein